MQEILTRAPQPTALLLAVAMVGATAWQVYHFWQDIQQPAIAPPAPETALSRTRDRPTVDLASVKLFGTAGEEVATEVDTASLPVTNLRLVLRGVSASGAEQAEDGLTSALVEGPDRQTDYYVVGSELPGNAALKAVYADRIVIERQGTLENLYFPEEFETASFETQDAQPAFSRNESVNQPVQNSAAQLGSGASDARKEEIRARLERLRERLRSNN